MATNSEYPALNYPKAFEEVVKKLLERMKKIIAFSVTPITVILYGSI